MKSKHLLMLALSAAAACAGEGSERSVDAHRDSIRLVSKHLQLEKAVWDYYVAVEADVRKDLGVSETETVERVQSMIDDGYVEEPVMLVITQEGARWKTVDYQTYKEYMTSNATIVRRYYGRQPDVFDSVLMDSIRSNLLKALHSDAPGAGYNDQSPE